MNLCTERITAHPFFRKMKPEHLKLVCECATEARFKAGDVLFREGEPANRFYLIEAGKIALEAHQPADGTIHIDTFGATDVLGWSWLFPPFVWHFGAHAVEPTTAIVLDGGHLLALAERDPAFGYDLLKRVSQLVIRRLQTTRKQLFSRPAAAVSA